VWRWRGAVLWVGRGASPNPPQGMRELYPNFYDSATMHVRRAAPPSTLAGSRSRRCPRWRRLSADAMFSNKQTRAACAGAEGTSMQTRQVWYNFEMELVAVFDMSEPWVWVSYKFNGSRGGCSSQRPGQLWRPVSCSFLSLLLLFLLLLLPPSPPLPWPCRPTRSVTR
jgi:hypothetical protein